MTHEEVWNSEIASLRSQAARRSGYVVCSADAYLALFDFRRSYWAAVRLDKLNGTNRAAGLSPDSLSLARVCRNIDEVLTFDKAEAERLAGRMGWAKELSDEPFISCTIQQMVEIRAAAIREEQQLP